MQVLEIARGLLQAQQVAKMVVKALILGLGQPARGHSGSALLGQVADLQIPVPEPLLEATQRLDRLYTPSRCPNAHPTGSPFEFYDSADAEQAITNARQVLDFVWETFRNDQMAAGA